MTDYGFTLSATDPSVEALPDSMRRNVARLWRRRATSERRAGAVFADLHRSLVAFGAARPVLELCASAVQDELRHGELCAELSRRYDAHVASPELAAPILPPEFPRREAHVAQALFAALQSSVNETLATGYMGACLDQAVGVWSREALRAILRDEVRHARIGWAVLASSRLSRDDRSNIAGTMPRLLEVCVAAWWADLEPGESAELPEGHGSLARPALIACVRETLIHVILPGLEHVGVDPTPARRWVEAHALASAS